MSNDSPVSVANDPDIQSCLDAVAGVRVIDRQPVDEHEQHLRLLREVILLENERGELHDKLICAYGEVARLTGAYEACRDERDELAQKVRELEPELAFYVRGCDELKEKLRRRADGQ